jgi:hypothetical protein
MKKHITTLFIFIALFFPVSVSLAQVGTGQNVFIEAGSDYGSGAQVGNDIATNYFFNEPLGAGSGEKDLQWLVALIIDLINRVIPLIFAMAVVVILWGIAQSVSGSEEKRAEGKAIIVWGVVGLFAMLSIWGLVNILVGTFDLDNSRVVIPTV